MTPVLQNILVTIAGFIYVFSVVWIMDWAVKRGLSQDISRKVVHIAAGSWLIFWALYDPTHWTKYLNICPAALWTILLLIKGLTAKDDDEAVKTMTRTGDRRELLKGPLFFTIVMDLMGTLFFFTPAAAISMGMLGWGDGMAPVIGKMYGKHKYKILSEKTVEGSLAFFIFGFAGAASFQLLLFSKVDILTTLIFALIATIIEGISPKDVDNLLIPASILIIYHLFI